MVQRESPDEVGLLNHYALTWQYIADYFNGNPDVAGYEIMNEPWGGSNGVGSYFGAQILTPFYNQVISAIRSVDPSTSVYFEPDLLTTNGLPLTLGTVDDPNTVLSFHDYADKFLPGFGLGAQSASNAVQYGNSHNIPVFLSEFGSTNDNRDLPVQLLHRAGRRPGQFRWRLHDHDLDSGGGISERLSGECHRRPRGAGAQRRRADHRIERRRRHRHGHGAARRLAQACPATMSTNSRWIRRSPVTSG
ncbi:glycoside hydrolase family 5 protein [Mycobacterium novum]